MPAYTYRARDRLGRLEHGRVEAEDEFSAARALRARGLVVTHLAPERGPGVLRGLARADRRGGSPSAEGPGSASAPRPARRAGGVPALFGSRALARRGRMPYRSLAVVCRQLATMLGAGVNILSALQTLARQTDNPRARAAVAAVIGHVEAGDPLADALRREEPLFPPLVANMVAAGEAGGILEDVLLRLAEHYEKEEAIGQKVRTSLTYPAVVSVFAVGVLIFLVSYVFPNFVFFFQQLEAELPWPTRFLLDVSRFLGRWWAVLLLGLAGAAFAARTAASTPRGRRAWERLLFRLPAIGRLLLLRELARFARTLGALHRSGVPLMAALGVVQRTLDRRVVADAVARAQRALEEGRSITGPLLASGYFPPLVGEMIAVGEETGAMDAMLNKLADFYDREVDALATQLASLVEPVVIVLLGGAVAFITVAMFLPLYDLLRIVGR